MIIFFNLDRWISRIKGINHEDLYTFCNSWFGFLKRADSSETARFCVSEERIDHVKDRELPDGPRSVVAFEDAFVEDRVL